jgi:hypothetical protein
MTRLELVLSNVSAGFLVVHKDSVSFRLAIQGEDVSRRQRLGWVCWQRASEVRMLHLPYRRRILFSSC